jgi:hypothetical protein
MLIWFSVIIIIMLLVHIEMDLQEVGLEDMAWIAMKGSCESGNELSVSIKCEY